MFKRKKQVAPPPKPPPPLPPPPPGVVHRRSVAKLTVSECLQQAQGALRKLRTINPGDLQAFPLLNEVQRLVQQLKDATASLPPADREAWSFQIADLEDEFRELADMVVSRADAAPRPEPRLASPASYSNSGAGARSSKTQTLLSPSNSGRVQQAVALFSRQEGFSNGSNQAAGLRRVQTTYQQQQQAPQQLQQQAPQQQQHPQQNQQHFSQQQYLQHSLHQLHQQQQLHQLQLAEQPYPQAASSVASTPARSDSSFIYLTDEERELLAQKQQALLQKHFRYLTQQRDAADEEAGARSALVSVQQIDPTAMQQHPHHQQQAQVPLAAVYHEQQQRRGPPSEYSSVQATPHADATDGRQSPAWSTTGVQGTTIRAQALATGRHAVGVAAAPWHAGGDAAAAAVAAYGQHHQGPYSVAQPGLEAKQRQPEEQGESVRGENVEDEADLFSGLEIVATDEQHSLAQPPQEATGPEQAHAQSQHPAARGLVTAAAGGQAAGSSDALQPHPQQVPTHSFRPAAHSMPHQFYAASQVGSRAGSVGPSQQEAPADLRSIQQAEPVPGASDQAGGSLQQPSTGVPDQPQQDMLQQQQLLQQRQQGLQQQVYFSHTPLQQGAQQAELQQQYPQHRQQSASAQGYHHAHPAVEVGGQAFNALASPSWRGIAGEASKQVSPFSQAASETASGAGPAVSASAASFASSMPYPIRKKATHIKLGYGVEDEASSQGRQQIAPEGSDVAERHFLQDVAEQPGVSGASDGAGPGITGAQEQQQLVQAVGYQHQQQGDLSVPSAWVLQQQQALLQQQAGRSGSSFPQQQPTQQQLRPTTPGHADQPAFAPATEQGWVDPGNLPQVPPYGMQYLQQQQQVQFQQQYLHQQYPTHEAQQHPTNPQLVPGTDFARYLHVHPHEGAQQPPQDAQQLQQQYPVNAAQQQGRPNASTYAPGPETDSGRYPQVWQRDAAKDAPQQAQQPQDAEHMQQAYSAQHAQQQQLLLQQQEQQDSRHALQLQQVQPAQQMQVAEHYLQQARQQQVQQQLVQVSPWSRTDADEQARRNVATAQPAQLYLASLVPPTPEEQARTQLLQKIVDSVPPAMALMGARSEQLYAHTAGGTGRASASGYQGNGLEHAPPATASASSSLQQANGLLSATGAAAALAVGAPGPRVSDAALGGTATAPSPAAAITVANLAASSATPAAAAVPAGPSPYISAFSQSAVSAAAADRASALAGNSPPRAVPLAMTPSAAEPMARAAAPLTPLQAATPAAQALAWPHPQRGSLTNAHVPAQSPALSLPLSSGGLRTRSRGLASCGGGLGGGGGGLAADPSASLPTVSSLPNLVDLEAFLNNITGSVDACRTAAEQRAREMVSALAAALSQAQKMEANVQQQRRVVKAALAGASASIAQLEGDQAAAVDGEDFDTAAALDDQISQLLYRRTSMDEQVQLLADALQRAAALRLQVLGRQAEVWRVTGAYLSRLQGGQQQMAATLASQADREAQAAAMLHRAAQEALAQRRGALEERNADLENTSAEVAAQVAAATAPAEAERQRRSGARDALQAEVESLRALLAVKEAALAGVEAAVVEAADAVRQQAAAYDQDLARLEEARRQLEAEAAQMAGHEQALQDSERQAEARAAAVEEHQAQLRLQADALGAAAGTMRCEAEALAQRVAAEARSQEQRERLLQADEKAREELKGLERCISDLSADLSRLAERRGRLATERAAVQEGLAGLQRSLPELETAKRAAAANKDFREAARLSGELRALSAQADAGAAQLARVSGEVSELAAIESGKVSELEDLRAMVHDAQRHAAEAHHRHLVFSLGLSRAALEEAVGSELYEEAGALQAEVAAEEAEVLALERTWGFARPAVAAAAAAAARRRTSLEATVAAAATSAQLSAQFSRQSLGSLSAQSSRSLSSQLLPAAPPAHPPPQSQSQGGQGAAGLLKAFLPGAGGHLGNTSPTVPPVWQHMHSQPQYHSPHPQQLQQQPLHVQQQQVSPLPVPTGTRGAERDSTAAAAMCPPQPPIFQAPASPLAYRLPLPPPDAAAAAPGAPAVDAQDADAVGSGALAAAAAVPSFSLAAMGPGGPAAAQAAGAASATCGSAAPAELQPPTWRGDVQADSLCDDDGRSAPTGSGAPTPGVSLGAAGTRGEDASEPSRPAAAAAVAAAPAPAGPTTSVPDAAGSGVLHSDEDGGQYGGQQYDDGERGTLQSTPLVRQGSALKGAATSGMMSGAGSSLAAESAAAEGGEEHAVQLQPSGHATHAPAPGGPAEWEGGNDAAAQASTGRPAGCGGVGEPAAPSHGAPKDGGLGEEPAGESAAANSTGMGVTD